MTTVRFVDDSGAELLNLNGDGIANFNPILRSLDFGYPEVRTIVTPRSGMDGADDLTTYAGPRGITAEVVIPFEGLAAADTIRALMHPGRRYWLHVKMESWSAERRIRVRGASLSIPMQPPPWPAQLGWSAPTPNFMDVAASSVTLSPQASSGGGLAFPVAFPVQFQPGLVPGAALLTVSGNANVHPTVDIYGPCTGPLVRVVDTGTQMSFPQLSIAAGDYLHIDTAARTVTLNNDPSRPQYQWMDFASSQWLWMAPGAGVQVVFSPASSSAPCNAVVSWRSQWL